MNSIVPSATTDSSMNNNDRKRRRVSLSNKKRFRRSQLVKTSNNEVFNRSLSISGSLTNINNMTQEYSLKSGIHLNKQPSIFRTYSDSYENNNCDIKWENSSKPEMGM